MPASNSRAEHCVLHRILNGTSTEVVINSVTTAEKVQKIRVAVDRSLCYLRIDAPLWQLFGDEHGEKIVLPTLRLRPELHGVDPISIPRAASRGNAAPVPAGSARELSHKRRVAQVSWFSRPGEVRHFMLLPMIDNVCQSQYLES